MNLSKILVGTSFLFTLTGCASLLNDATQNIQVHTSNDKTIEAQVDGTNFVAPGKVTVTRKQTPLMLSTSAAGCAPLTPSTPSIDNVFWGNIILGGVFGSSTDYSTGKMWEYQESVTIACQD